MATLGKNWEHPKPKACTKKLEFPSKEKFTQEIVQIKNILTCKVFDEWQKIKKINRRDVTCSNEIRPHKF